MKLHDFCRRASAADLEKENVNVVRLTSATEDRRAIVMALSTDCAGVRSPAHRGADCRRPRATCRGRNSGSGPDHFSQERISELVIDRLVDVPVVVIQRWVPTIQTVLETVEVLQVQIP